MNAKPKNYCTAESPDACSLFILTACIALCPIQFALHARSPVQAEPPSPNVILIMTDDQGIGDFGFVGNSGIQTPNLDRLASGSARLETFYVHPVCTPTRAALMTGRHPQRTRAIDTWMGRAMLEPEETTVAEILQSAGWSTGIFGKWHLGDCYPMRPQDQGFDEVLVHRGGGIGQPADPIGAEGRYTDPVLFHNGQAVQEYGYCTDIYFERAMEWMKTQRGAAKPFFAYIATNAPHGPFHDVPESLYRKYKAGNLIPDALHQQETHPLPDKYDQDKLARIYAMVENIDINVGKLLDYLHRDGLLHDTLILFLLDNGPNTRRYVNGWRGMKSEVYEGGIRSPLWAHWPKRLNPGTIRNSPAAHIDVLPTILAACEINPPEGLLLDGRSLWSQLQGKDAPWPQRSVIIQAHRGDAAVRFHNFMLRRNKWKLLNASGFHRELEAVIPQFELYDLHEDPFEQSNLAGKFPQTVAELQREYEEWFENVSQTRPDNYAPPRIILGNEEAPDVVLTRQDWRRMKPGSTWGRNARGYWRVLVEPNSFFRIRAHFPKNIQPESILLKWGTGSWFEVVSSSSSSHRYVDFPLIHIPGGLHRLEVRFQQGEKIFGAYQVEVRKVAKPLNQ